MATLDPAGVAEALKINEGRFRRKWRTIVKANGFPPPLPGLGLRWSSSQVEAWIAAGGVMAPVDVERPPSVVDAARSSLPATQREGDMNVPRIGRTIMLRVSCPRDMTHMQAKHELIELVNRHSWNISVTPAQQHNAPNWSWPPKRVYGASKP